jgi:quinol-cytochrome oxidoreductase complex cytochrome b subunit
VNLQATGPFVGPFLGDILRGGAEIGPDTLARFYSLHMLVLPGAIAGLIGLHLYLVVRLGVVSPPWTTEPAGSERPGPPPAPRSGLVAPSPRGARRR